MAKQKVLREVKIDVNRDGTIAGTHLTFDVFLEDEGVLVAIPQETRDGTEEEVAEFLGPGVLAASEAVREAHGLIAGMQKLVKEKDALISAKDTYIAALVAECEHRAEHQAERTERGRQLATIYEKAILDAPKARDA